MYKHLITIPRGVPNGIETYLLHLGVAYQRLDDFQQFEPDDIVCIHGGPPHALSTGDQGVKLQFLLNINNPTVLFIHERSIGACQRLPGYPALIQKANAVFMHQPDPDLSMIAKIVRGINPTAQKGRILLPYRFDPDFEMPDHKPLSCVFVGRTNKVKRYDLAANFFQSVPMHCSFYMNVPKCEIKNVFDNHAFAIVPTELQPDEYGMTHEYVAYEAANAGCVLILHSNTQRSSLGKDLGSNALYINDYNFPEVAAQIKSLCDRPLELRRMASKTRRVLSDRSNPAQIQMMIDQEVDLMPMNIRKSGVAHSATLQRLK